MTLTALTAVSSTTSDTDITITLPDIPAGNTIIVCATNCQNARTISSITDSRGDTYVKPTGSEANNSNAAVGWFYILSCSHHLAGDTIKVTWSGLAIAKTLEVWYTNDIAAYDQAAIATGTGPTAINLSSGTLAQPNSMAFAATTHANGNTYTPNSPWVEDATVNPNARRTTFERIANVGSTSPVNFAPTTVNNSNVWAASLLVFKLNYSQATLAVTLAGATLSAAAKVDVAASSNIALSGVTAAGTGEVLVKAAVSITLAGASLSSQAAVEVRGSASIQLQGAVLSAAGKAEVSGIVSSALEGALLAATAEAGIIGSLNVTLQGVTLNAQGLIEVHGTLVVMLDGVTLDSDAHVGAQFVPGEFTAVITIQPVLEGQADLEQALGGSLSLMTGISGSVTLQ